MMKSLLFTSITLLVTASFLLGQTSSKDIVISKANVSLAQQDTLVGESTKREVKVVKKCDGSSSNGQIIIKTVSKDGKRTKKQLDFTSMNEGEIDHLIDSIMNGQLEELDIDIQLFGDSKIKVIQLPSGEGENIMFESFDFGSNIEWIDIEDMVEVEEIHKAGKVKPFLGVILDDEIHTENGITIVSVIENGSAQAAGVLKDDILTGLDDSKINSLKDIGHVLKEKEIGQEVSMHVLRSGVAKTLTSKLKSKEECNYNLSNSFNFKMPECCKGEQSCAHHQRTYKAYAVKSKPKLGVNISDLDKEMITDLRIKKGKGVLLTKVYAESVAAKIGLKLNDVITKINDTTINNSEDLHTFLSNQNIGDVIVITYFRYGKQKTTTGELYEFNNYNFNN